MHTFIFQSKCSKRIKKANLVAWKHFKSKALFCNKKQMNVFYFWVLFTLLINLARGNLGAKLYLNILLHEWSSWPAGLFPNTTHLLFDPLPFPEWLLLGGREKKRYLVHSSRASHLRWAWKLMISCTLQPPPPSQSLVVYSKSSGLFCALFFHACFIQFVAIPFFFSYSLWHSISCAVHTASLTILGS